MIECQEVGGFEDAIGESCKYFRTGAEQPFYTEMRHSVAKEECLRLFRARASRISLFGSKLTMK